VKVAGSSRSHQLWADQQIQKGKSGTWRSLGSEMEGDETLQSIRRLM